MLSREGVQSAWEREDETALYQSHLEALDRLADLEATLDRADKHTEWLVEKLEAMEKENAALKARLADAERKAVEREREAAEWVLRHFDISLPDSYSQPVLTDLCEQLTREIERRYPTLEGHDERSETTR